MFTAEENELLTHVGPGTPTGDVMRRYWLPALVSEELPEPDCPPVRTRLLGEDLVAFRDTNGRIGLIAEKCAHRRASLFFGRNEECGLRCIYHGWKYDVDGNIVDTPAEPVESMVKRHVKQIAYPCVEVNGLVWTYMGPKEKKPPLPDFPWFSLPRENMDPGYKCLIECSWLQCIEGDNDSVHSAYLHRRRRPGTTESRESVARRGQAMVDLDVSKCGVRAATKYPMDDGSLFVRTNTFSMPCFGSTPCGSGEVNEGSRIHFQVPRDDYSNWRYTMEIYWNRPASGHERENLEEVGPGFKKLFNRENDYLIDRARQKSGEIYCGIDAGNHTQDACVTETMGVVSDREHEHLGLSDTHIIEMRRFYLNAIKDVQAGKDPPGIFFTPEENRMGNWQHMITVVLPREKDWRDVLPAVDDWRDWVKSGGAVQRVLAGGEP
jgi:phthalate 4,5-dioxygenase oxygenase subunit